MKDARRDLFVRAYDEFDGVTLAQVAARGANLAGRKAVQLAQLGGDPLRRQTARVGVRQGVDLPRVPRKIAFAGQAGPNGRSASLESFGRVGGRSVAGQVLHGLLVQLGQHLGLPAVPHARPHGCEIGRRQHEQHVEHLGRTDVDGEPHDELIVARVAPECQVRHDQVLVHQEFQHLGFAHRQPQPAGRLVGDTQANVAVVFDEPLAQVVNQQGQVQRALLLDAPVDAAQHSRVGAEVGRPLDRQDAMLVDGVLVIFVELQQAAGVGEVGNDFFQHAQLVQTAQQFAEPAGLGDEREELAGDSRGHLAVQSRHGRSHRIPRGGRNPLVVQIGQLA